MIRTNLATRPFFNDRAVRLLLTALALLVLVATLFNAWRFIYYSGSNTELVAQAERDEARARELRSNASRLRASVDVKQIEEVSTDAREANDLIDRRTFSWTELLNRFEATLPPEVRIRSVRPTLDNERHIRLAIGVQARGVDDVNEFMENLDATHAFSNVTAVQERTTEDGQIETMLDAVYAAPATAPPGTPAAETAQPAAPQAPTATGGAR